MFRFAVALIVGLALPIAAQIGRFPRQGFGTGPKYWVGLSYGFVEGIRLTDESTQGTWDFSYAPQIRATFEKNLQRGVSFGVSAGFTTAKLAYQATVVSNPCSFGCSANADITQYMVFLRGGTGIGFHGVYNLEGGVTRFSNFRERESGNRLPPQKATNDMTFGFGGGLGYGFASNSEVYVGQQIDLVMHPSDGTQGGAPRLGVFRGGFRFGF
jgi:hypothetical protein